MTCGAIAAEAGQSASTAIEIDPAAIGHPFSARNYSSGVSRLIPVWRTLSPAAGDFGAGCGRERGSDLAGEFGDGGSETGESAGAGGSDGIGAVGVPGHGVRAAVQESGVFEPVQ